ncbi:hypothetical protein [Bradyrhizobium prioriisuperbiae]|uniref:hypothetical protein n=1 Tax=Bradyrhizobium prioriisuperbiae TaxID=2854389 RepID=UPI0028EAC4F5|nr:hypothetical protein [Bradyrhizobium prioritasuperba]
MTSISMLSIPSLPRLVVTVLTAMFFSDLAFYPMPPAMAEPASPIASIYTSTADKACRKVSSVKVGDDEEYGSERICPGAAGLVVLKIEQDLREIISVGRNRKQAGAEPAASQSFGPFNSTTDTIEWRSGSDGKPFAMIQRWHIADNSDTGANSAKVDTGFALEFAPDNKRRVFFTRTGTHFARKRADKDGRPITKQMLVVTRLPPGAVCHVAYVDVKANPNANAVARKAADDMARSFDCARDKVTSAGEKGRTTELALPRR